MSQKKRIALWVSAIFILVIWAYFVNATKNFYRPVELFGRSKFVLAFILTFFLLSWYVYSIYKVYRTDWIQKNKQSGGKRWHVVKIGLFLLITLLHATILQFLLLIVTDKWIWETSYFKKEYPFLGIPLALYILVLEWLPFVRIPKAPRHEQNSLPDMAQADQEDLVRFVPEGDTEHASSGDQGSLDFNMPLEDIVGGESHNKYCILYLTTGEQFPVSFSLTQLASKWPENLIIKTNGRFFVLVPAVDLARSTSKRIALKPKIREQLERSLEKETLGNLLSVSRYYRSVIREFLESADSGNTDNGDI